MSLEKEHTLIALGAHIIRTPTSAPSQSPESNLGVAQRLRGLIPGGVILNQYENVNNPEAHEWGTGKEIVEAVEGAVVEGKAGEGVDGKGRKTSGRVDVFVAGAGTGGTLSGTSKALKKSNKDVIVVGVDPVSCSYLILPLFVFSWKVGTKSLSPHSAFRV